MRSLNKGSRQASAMPIYAMPCQAQPNFQYVPSRALENGSKCKVKANVDAVGI